MRINIYAEEITDKVELVEKEADGHIFFGVRFWLELPVTKDGNQISGPSMHRADDNDSSAVTFWGKRDVRLALRKALALLDEHYASEKNA